MRVLRSGCIVVAMLIGSHSSFAQTSTCDSFVPLPSPPWVVEERVAIRIDDEVKRNEYAQSILQKGDILFLVRNAVPTETALKFSSIYTRLLGDPENVRRYFSTQSQVRRAAELRQKLFSVKTAGELGRPAPGAELSGIVSLLSDSLLRRWQNEDWIGDFPALVINRAPASLFKELMLLEQNAGDFLAEERSVEKSAMMALGDGSIGIRVEFVSKQGALSEAVYPNLAVALYNLQIKKPQLCTAFFHLIRYWVSRPFLEQYAISYRAGAVHLHGQIPIWEEATRANIRDVNIFPLLKDAFLVSGAFFSVRGDRIILDRWLLEPLVPSMQ